MIIVVALPNGSNGIPKSSINSFSPNGDGQLSLMTYIYFSLFMDFKKQVLVD
jgi:hypothetical protein